jgi:hypothetical protein
MNSPAAVGERRFRRRDIGRLRGTLPRPMRLVDIEPMTGVEADSDDLPRLDRDRRLDDLAINDPDATELATVPQTQDHDPVAATSLWRFRELSSERVGELRQASLPSSWILGGPPTIAALESSYWTLVGACEWLSLDSRHATQPARRTRVGSRFWSRG